MYPYPGAPVPRARRLTFKELIVGTFQILSRTWPFILASALAYVVAVGILSAVLVFVLMAIADALESDTTEYADMESAMQTAAIFGVIGWLVVLVVNAILDVPWIGIVAVATDSTIRNRQRPTAREVFTRIRSRFVPLAAVFTIMLVAPFLLMVLLVVLVPAEVYYSSGGMIAFSLFAFVVMVSMVIAMEFAPWAVLFEGKGVFAALRRAAGLARQALPQLIGLHVLWACVGAPLLILGFALPLALMGMVLIAGGIFIAMCYFTCQGIVYADIRAVEDGGSLELCFAVPPVPLSRGWSEVREMIGAGAPVQPGPPRFDGPGPSGARPANPSPFIRPTPTATFRPAPGWPSPPSAGWVPSHDWRPDPSWPVPPPGWQFWI
ncbi:hypothetical protein [Tsukamurella pseudospumae]|uniref:Glycerophosphoryl diester phosphodiesterase membrane domain-containing protein n=1 Tax=Tsukamurella pseudospumae TaxID=239498 RepID=A0A138AIL6_9ACTN|nr:hypothetical protein [Tsukamurella pseudospumae]KXP10224.1 hypothetical protein AXK60_07065 [Tsukamurella pseudospumae]